MVQKIKLRRGDKVNVPSLDQGEPAVTLDTKELVLGSPSGNFNVMNRNHVFMPINYADKSSGFNHFIKTSGTGTLIYDPAAPSAMGTGAYRITGNGTWVLQEIYAVCPLSGIGGHVAVQSASGSAVVSAGTIFYEDDKTTVIGTVAQQSFISNAVATTGSYVLSKAVIHNEGAGNDQLPVGARWLKPQITVASNTGDVLLDCWMVFPLNFALIALYT